MSDNPAYETAPLKTEYILDLDNFNEGIESAEERLKSFKEMVEDIAIKLNITSNIANIKEELNSLDDNKTVKVNIEGGGTDSINPVDSDDIEQVNNLNKVLRESINLENELAEEAGRVSEELKKGFNDNFSRLDDGIKETSEDLEGLSRNIDDIDIKFERLKELAEIQGNVDIEGLRGTIEGMNELQNELSEVNAKAIELNSTSNISDEEMNGFQDRVSDSAFEMSKFQDDLGDTIAGFQDSVAPIHESSEGFHEFGEKMMESGQMTLYTGMMISSIMQPIANAGEASFKLGLASSTAMQISSHAFGNNAKVVEIWSDGATKSLGITTGAALQSAEKFGFATRTMGANAKQSATLGENYTELASHIMLTSNGTMSFSQAQQMAMAVMKGQTFQTKALGLTFTATALRAEELKLGFHGAFKSLTPLQQATVRYHVAQDELNKAYGTTSSLLKTSNGKWLIAKATLESTGEVIGERLLPFVLKCAKGLEELGTWFEHLSKTGQDFILIVGAIALAIGPLVMGIGALTLGIGAIADGIGVATTVFTAFDAVLLANPIIAIITAIIAVCALLYEAWKHNWFGLRTISIEVFDDIKKAFDKFNLGIKGAALMLLSFINPFIGLPLLLTDAWRHNFMNIQGITKKFILDIESYYEEFKNYCGERWQDIVNDTAKYLANIGVSIESNFERYKNDIVRHLSNIGNSIESHFDRYKSDLTSSLENIGSDIGLGFDKFKNYVSEGLVDIGNDIKSGTLHFISYVKNSLDHVGSDISSGFDKFVDYVSTGIENIGSDIQSGFDKFVNYASTGLHNVFSAMVSLIENSPVLDSTAKLVESIIHLVKTLATSSVRIVGALLRMIGRIVMSGLDDVLQTTESIGNSIFDAAKQVWNEISTTTKEIWTDISNFMTTTWNDISNTFTTILSSIEAFCSSTWNDISSTTNEVWNSITNFIDSTWDDIKNTFFTHLNSIENTCDTTWNDISTTTTEIWNDISNFMSATWIAIKNIFLSKLHSIKAFCDTTWNDISTTTKDIWNDLSNFFGEIWSDISNTFTSSLDAVKNISSSVWNSIKSLTISIWDSISNFFGEVWSDIESTTDESISAVKSVVVSGWNSIIGWLRSVISEPVNIILSLGSAMENAGSNLISSMLHGAEGEWGRFTGWLTSSIDRISNWVSSETSHLVGELNGVDGSHATGLNYVPWDGYTAQLHRGEMVLTAEQAQQFRGNTTSNSNITINAPGSNPNDIASTVQKTLNDMANGFM